MVEFLEQWSFKAADQVATEVWMEENNEDTDAGALWFLRNFRDVWASFVPDDVAKQGGRSTPRRGLAPLRA